MNTKDDNTIEARALMMIGEFQRTMKSEFNLYCSIYVANKQVVKSSHSPDIPISSLWLTIVQCAWELDRMDIVKNVNRRHRETLIYRQIYCYIARNMGYTFKSIGLAINKDHSTVIHSYKTITDLLEVKDQEVTGFYKKITAYIKLKENAILIEPSNTAQDDDESDSVSLLLEEQDKDTGSISSKSSSSEVTD